MKYYFPISNNKFRISIIDPESPRDYIDFLLLEGRVNKDIGYHSIVMSVIFMYVAGADTISTTMRWLCILLVRLL